MAICTSKRRESDPISRLTAGSALGEQEALDAEAQAVLEDELDGGSEHQQHERVGIDPVLEPASPREFQVLTHSEHGGEEQLIRGDSGVFMRRRVPIVRQPCSRHLHHNAVIR